MAEEKRAKSQKPARRKRSDGGLGIRGFWRVNLVSQDAHGNAKIDGDSGWVHNTITLTGLQNLASLLFGTTGSTIVNRGALGTGAAPATNATSLPGEFGDATGAASTGNRPTHTALNSGVTNTSNVNISYLFTWLSSNSFTTTTRNISNIGLYPNTNSGGSIFCGATYASSLLSMNQDVQATYVLRLGT